MSREGEKDSVVQFDTYGEFVTSIDAAQFSEIHGGVLDGLCGPPPPPPPVNQICPNLRCGGLDIVCG